MTLLEMTYRQLRSAELVDCAEGFSRAYLGKGKNWYAYQKFSGRDYSIDAAMQCLRSVRVKQHTPNTSRSQRHVLRHVETQLAAHLSARYGVAEVC